MIIDGIPKRPLYFYQKDIIEINYFDWAIFNTLAFWILDGFIIPANSHVQ